MTLTSSCPYPTCMALVLSVLFLVPPGMAQAGEIYRHVDENGNVTYSDEPPEKDSKPMELAPLTEINIPQRDRSSNVRDRDPQAEEAEDASLYNSVEITEPEHDSAFWRGGGQVTIRVSSEPDLSEGHRYQLEFDGEPGQKSRSTTFSLDNVDRGTHEVVVHILDANGNVITSSDTTRFTLHRPSQLN